MTYMTRVNDHGLNVAIRTLLIAAGTLVLVTLLLASPPRQQATTDTATASAQKTFATPEAAVDELIRATGEYDVPALKQIFGPEGADFISTADPVQDKNKAEAFAAFAKEKHFLASDPTNQHRLVLNVGPNDWPLPIPLVKKSGKWMFDTAAGRQELLYRRIGTNELDAIQICRGYVQAQKVYALTVHDDSGVNEYAQKILSSPGKQDGLYWKNSDGTPGGPLSEPAARAIAEGYTLDKKSAYHGYYFKILKGQGPAAPLGRLDYVIQGAMIGGFALIAVPAEYRVTGVKTFLVSQDGVVYQKDLGPDTLNVAKGIELYNPDKTWQITTDEWPGTPDNSDIETAEVE
ncbi:MAG TPA: DUF2950 domain-containing protein [Terracidiphilus sp.]|nr:DUF2950 domain-containing protein [Terracidiphilus sp.]